MLANPLFDINDETKQFLSAFGAGGLDLNIGVLNIINAIRLNEPSVTRFSMSYGSFNAVSNLGCELLGRYITNNTHLKEIDLKSNGMNDAQSTALFGGLMKSSSINSFNLGGNSIGVNGLRSMVPFLENASNLSTLYLYNNEINSEGFQLVISALNGRSSMKDLWFGHCSIEDISILNTHTLPNLQKLVLKHNNIGRDGCIVIANLLRNEDSTLEILNLDGTGMGDDEAEILATSLKRNTKLKQLLLANNNIGEKGKGSFLKLLNDISSIESTYNSNNTLTSLDFLEAGYSGEDVIACPFLSKISTACRQNRIATSSSNPQAAGRAKVIHSQLNSQRRKEYCQLQGIGFSSIGNLLVGIEPNLLPDTLALIGNNHGQSELYTALIPLAPELLSFIDRKALLKDTMTKNAADIIEITAEHARQVAAFNAKLAALNAKGCEFERRLACMEAEECSQSKIVDVNKRQRMC